METHVERSEPDVRTTAMVGVVGTILLVVIVYAVQGLYESAQRAELEKKVVSQVPEELRSLRAAQRARLAEMRWVDRERGVIAIPIERAMELMAADPDPAAPVVPAAGPKP
ncbi:MAG TPA: hypothetical protein VFB67_04770 [Candidatus Polarisedimenticolaceae bacterium]|nr:hypothetical protein [Candidatus Polarisedimenticolaceae bacterium]